MADATLSYWQRGCNDGKAGKPRTPPFTAAHRCFPPTGWTSHGMSLASAGYDNGYDWGRKQRKPILLAPLMGGIRPNGVRLDPLGKVIVDIELP